MKPDWSKAPPWATCLAMDDGGYWYWYEKTPRLGSQTWNDNGGDFLYAGTTASNWKDSLEFRP